MFINYVAFHSWKFKKKLVTNILSSDDVSAMLCGVLCPVLGPAAEEGCGQAREGPEKGHKDNHNAGAHLL